MHKKFSTILRFSILFIVCNLILFSQNNEWVNYPYGKEVLSVTGDGDYIWVGTSQAGIVKLNSVTGEKIFFNKDNSSLPGNKVYCIISDSSGVLWIGTNGGLVRFDGINWNIYNTSNSGLPNNNVSSITFDSEKNMWIGTRGGGVAKYNGIDWEIFNTSNTDYGVNSNKIFTIVIDSVGNKWIGTDAGISKYREDNWFTHYDIGNLGLGGNQVFSIIIDAYGNKWFGTSGGLAKFDDQNWSVYMTSNSQLPGYSVLSLALDGNGNIWVGTVNGLAKFDETTWTVFNTSNSDLQDNLINAIFMDNNSDMWLGTSFKLAKFNGTNWTTFDVDQGGLTSTYINAITFDKDNNAWICVYDPFGTEHHSFVKFDGENWIAHTFPDRKYTWTLSILADNSGNVWVGTGGGLLKYHGSDWVSFDSSYSMFTDKKINSLTTDVNGNLWIGCQLGLVKFDGATITLYNPPNSYGVSAVCIDSSGNIWAETGSGGSGQLNKWDGNEWKVYSYSHSKAEYMTVDKSNNIWIATFSGGLVRFDGTNWKTYNKSNSDLPSDNLETVIVDSVGNLWIGTWNGLVKFDGNHWTVYQTSNSDLEHNWVESLAFDKLNNLWIGTHNGISVYKEGGVILSAEEENNKQIPTNFTLSQNYPNPFNPNTTIEYSIPKRSHVTIKVYDLLGREIATLINEEKPAGNYSVNFDGSDLSSGIYFYRLTASEFNQTKKLILIK